MYLSKLVLDPRDMYAKQCMRDCQEMHRSVLRFFGLSRKDAGVLYRLDSKRMSLYILSKKAPDVNVFVDGFSFVGSNNIYSLLDNFVNGKVFCFNVKAFPCKQNRGKRSFIKEPDGRLAWFRIMAEKHGFLPLSVNASDTVDTVYGCHADELGGKFYYPSVEFSGVLKITDKDKFLAAYQEGFGRGRSYGLGMFLLK